jgi:SAM-dependent methyltransferase
MTAEVFVMTDDPRERFRELIETSRGADDPTAWFDRLYATAEETGARIPWDRGAPHRHLVQWAEERHIDGTGKRALVVGSGTGDDAEFVASLGFATTGFDIAPTAIRLARQRFPESTVTYQVADLFALPAGWSQAFDFVVENQTVQALPGDLRRHAIDAISGTVTPGGQLAVLAARAENGIAYDGPPWPLTRAEIDAFAEDGLRIVSIEALSLNGNPRWRAIYTRDS